MVSKQVACLTVDQISASELSNQVSEKKPDVSVKLLGVDIDKTLNFRNHIGNLLKLIIEDYVVA